MGIVGLSQVRNVSQSFGKLTVNLGDFVENRFKKSLSFVKISEESHLKKTLRFFSQCPSSLPSWFWNLRHNSWKWEMLEHWWLDQARDGVGVKRKLMSAPAPADTKSHDRMAIPFDTARNDWQCCERKRSSNSGFEDSLIFSFPQTLDIRTIKINKHRKMKWLSDHGMNRKKRKADDRRSQIRQSKRIPGHYHDRIVEQPTTCAHK
jgi:hypothetical protein